MNAGRIRLPETWAAVLVAVAGALAACDAPTAPAAGEPAVPGGPSMLITPACAGTGGQTHGTDITASESWTRANSPHRVTGPIFVDSLARLTIAPGAVVCFEPGTYLRVQGGARLYARGRDTAGIVFTGRDPARGWGGLRFAGAPAGASYLSNTRVEHVNVDHVAVASLDQHPVYVDSSVIRQAGRGVSFAAPGSRLVRSAVDSTTDRAGVAVELAAGSFESSVVRRAAGVGVRVTGPNVLLNGGRIEGSTDIGLQVVVDSISRFSRAIRVVGGGSHPAELSLPAMVRLYPTPALQDSLLGNARETTIIRGGTLRSSFTVGPRVPLRMISDVMVDSLGVFSAQPGARIYFDRNVTLYALNGGRLLSRGSAASPVLLTAEDPATGWGDTM